MYNKTAKLQCMQLHWRSGYIWLDYTWIKAWIAINVNKFEGLVVTSLNILHFRKYLLQTAAARVNDDNNDAEKTTADSGSSQEWQSMDLWQDLQLINITVIVWCPPSSWLGF